MVSSIPTFVPAPPAPILSFTSQSIPSGKIARFSTPGSVLTSAALTKPITGSLTLEGWIKPTSEATTDVIATLSAGSHAFNLSNPTDLTLTLGTSTLQTGIALGTGSWRHIAVALKPGQNGKFSVWVVVDNSLLFQAASFLDAPTGWPDNNQTLTIGKKGNGTALQGDYSEFRLWSMALPTGLIQSHYYNRILTGAPNLSLVWSLKALPANAVKTDVTFLAGDLTYFSDTLTAQWSVETGTTYGLFLQAQDNVWGEIYSDLTVGTQPITEYWLNHGITAKLQATQLGKNSAFSPISSGALFRLGLPQATLSATITNAVPKLELNWPAVDQTTDYIVTFHETGTRPTSSSQKSLTKDISNLLLIAKPTTITLGSKTGIVQSLPPTTVALESPVTTLSYDVATPGTPGDISLNWTPVDGAEKYLISWVVENGAAKDPEFVDGSVTSIPSFKPSGTDNVTYTAKVQALSTAGVGATATAQVVISNITAPTKISAITTPTVDQTAGSIMLAWDYAGPTTSGLGFEVQIDNETGGKVIGTETATKNHFFTNAAFISDKWFAGKIRYKAGNVTGPWAIMTVFILPHPSDFIASINASGDVVSVIFKSIAPAPLAAKGTSEEYTVRIVGPISGSDCTQVPGTPALDITLGPFTSKTQSWKASDIPGYDHLKAYSATVTAHAKNNGSASIPSDCDTLEKYVPVSTPPGGPTTNDPVGIASGNMIYFETGIELNAVFPINFTLFYNSGFPTHAENANIQDSDLGERWRHGFETCLVKDLANKQIYIISGSTDITVYRDTASSNGNFQPVSPYKGDNLIQGPSGSYILQHQDQTSWVFNSAGQATAARDQHGNQLDLAYSNGKLHQVKLKGGTPSLTFAYDGNGKIHTVTGSNGLILTITVTSNQLKTVQIPQIGTRHYSYASMGKSLLQQVVDPWGNSTVYNEYDNKGRVQKQYDATGYETSSKYYTYFVYGTTTYRGNTVNTTTVTQPEGDVTLYYSDPDSAAIVYQETALGHNPAGQPTSEIITTDYNGFMQPQYVRHYRGPKADYNYAKANLCTYVYDTNMNLISLTDADNKTQTWTYDSQNNLIHETDLWQNQKSYSYYPGNRLHMVTDAIGQTVTYEYWSGLAYEGLIKTVTDPYGNQSGMTYFPETGLINVLTNADQTTITITYTDTQRQEKIKTAEADGTPIMIITKTFDNLARPIMFAVQMNNQTPSYPFYYGWEYDTPTPNTIIRQLPGGVPNGPKVTYTLNANREVISETYEEFEGVTVHRTFSYDKNNRLKTVAMGSKAPTHYAYNGLDELISITNPLGHQETFFQQQVRTSGSGPYSSELIITRPKLNQFNPVSKKNEDYDYTDTQIFNPSGFKSRRMLSFYPAATPQQPTWSQKQEWSYITAQVPNGNSPYTAVTETLTTTPLAPTGTAINRSVTYNGLYRVVKSTNADNKQTTTAYEKVADPAGSSLHVMKVTQTPPVGTARDSFIDPQGRLLATSAGTSPEARASLFTRDAIGRPTQIRKGDTLTNLKAGTLTAPGAAQVDVSYRVESPEQRVYVDIQKTTNDPSSPAPLNQTLIFDGLNNLTGEIFTTGGSTAYEYTPWNSVAKRTLASDGVLSFGFDDAGYLLNVTPGSEEKISHTLDEAGNRTSTNVGASVSITREFDAWNRLTQRTEQGTTIKQEQWPNGWLRLLTYSDGKSVSYTLDGFGNLSTVKDWADRTTTYHYWPTGLLKTVTYPNDVVEAYAFNEAGAVTEYGLKGQNNVVISSLTIVPNQHNETGEINGIWSMPMPLPLQTETLTYNQDILETYQGQSLSSDDDKSLTQIPANGSLISTTYDSIGRLSTVGDTTYKYDADGFRSSKTEDNQSTTYTTVPNGYFDPLINMGDLKRDTNMGVYEPTDCGGGILSPVYGKNSHQILGQNPDLLLDWLIEYGEKPSPLNKIVNGIGPLYEEKSDNSVNFFHGDPFGNIIATTNAAGDITASANYDSFGKIHSDNLAGLSPFGYGGKFGVLADGNSLLSMRSRGYSPSLMRFTSRDLLSGNMVNPTSLNRFQYGLNNPYLYADPLGLSPLPKIIGGTLGGIAGVAVIGVIAAAAGGAFSEGGAFAGAGITIRGFFSNLVRAAERQLYRAMGRELGRELLERELWAGEEVIELIETRSARPIEELPEGLAQRRPFLFVDD